MRLVALGGFPVFLCSSADAELSRVERYSNNVRKKGILCEGKGLLVRNDIHSAITTDENSKMRFPSQSRLDST